MPQGKVKFLDERGSDLLVALLWLIFILSLVFLVDVKLTRYKLIGMKLSLIALMGVWFWRDVGYLRRILKDTVVIPLVILTLFFSGLYLIARNPSTAYSQWQRMIFSALAFFAAYRLAPVYHKKLFLNIIIITGGLMALYGILQKSGGVGRIQVPRLDRVFGTFGNPNFFASFLAGLIPLSAAWFWKNRKLWNIILIGFMAVALYYTRTRGAWLGLIGAGLFWWVLWGRKHLPKWLTVLLFAVIAVFVVATRGVWVRQMDRLLIWRDTLKMTAANPAFGVGLGEFHNEFPAYASRDLLEIFPQGKFIVNYAHNEFLELLAETGIVGFGLYIWFLSIFYYTVVSRSGKDAVKMGAVCGATAILIQSMVSVNMRFEVASIWAFLLMGLALGWDDKSSLKGLPLSMHRLIPAAFVFGILGIWGRDVVEPLVSHNRLSKEVDFFDKAKEYSEKELIEILKSQPGNAMAYYKLGWIQAKSRDFQEAIINFKKAVYIDDSLVGAYNNLGNIYYTMGNRDMAARYYVEAIKRKPDLVDAHFNLGYIYYYQGMLKEATREFTVVLKLDPDNYKAKIMLEKMVQ